ncbi:MAG: hypothetical protein DMG29_12520 [Acidobacteria bacterium]|nr:MAG: hypothetical protein DMG29_12520 [Acidobacteriota bacterium]
MFALVAALLLASTAALVPIAAGRAAQGTQPDRWLHVRVDNQEAKGELVRINLPLSFAEKVLPTIKHDKLRNGKITVDQANGVDLRALLEAVRTTKDGEFITVQGTTGDVRVAKQGGYLLVHARENKDGSKKRVEVRVPLTVVDALLSAGNNELDLVAGLRALGSQGDTELVTVKDEKSTVRIWLDSRSTSD